MKSFYILFACIAFNSFHNAVCQNIGIGTITPQSRLHIVDGSSGYAGGFFPGFTFEGSSNRYVNLIVPASNETGVLFGNTPTASHGGIIYNNVGTPSGLQFRTNGNNTRMVINSNGNVGIGTTSPGFPLNFSDVVGDKISLWGAGGAHYGFGIQSYLMQIHTDNPDADIAFGYGSSTSFVETMRAKGNGTFQFPAAIGKKIILYPGGIGDAHLGVFGNELRISSDYSGADITFGYDNRTTGYTEKFRMKANGGLAINGNVGADKQVLSSDGTSSSWKTLGSLIQTYSKTPGFLLNLEGATSPSNQTVVFTALTTTVTVTTKSRLIISAAFRGTNGGCIGCGDRWDLIDIRIDGVEMGSGVFAGVVDLIVGNGSTGSATISDFMYDVNPGTHTIEFIAQGSADMNLYSKYSTVIVLPID